MTRSRHLLAGALAGLIGVASATPYPHRAGPAPTDLGEAAALATDESITVTVALRLSNEQQLEPLLQAMYTRGAPLYHQFLTAAEFRARFGPSADTIAGLTRYFEAAGLTVTRSATAQLRVSGNAGAIERAFAVKLHRYAVAAAASGRGYVYRAPLAEPQLPAAISSSVQGVFGLDTRPRFFPHLRRAAGAAHAAQATTQSRTTSNPFGSLTVADFAQHYDLNPLYGRHIDGHGRTIGIVTLAGFTPSDAFAYWSALGLKVAKNRLKEVMIDGGPGAPSDDSGSLETTLDVEQSGGIAPGARILVYEAPNTNQGFVDAFAAAIDSNAADTVSTSWGEWELFDTPDNVFDNGPVTDPVTHRVTSIIQAYNDLLTQAALQGQSMFAAAGDAGAWDEVGELPSQFSNVISVDDPAAQPFITAMGGTTLPGAQTYPLPDGTDLTLHVAQEQAWGWDYLEPLCSALDLTIAQCGIFPAGGGGGVSVFFHRPFYQSFVPGMARSVAGQAVYDQSQNPPALVVALPAGFAGRNVPDISLNSDPQTGYVVAYTSDVSGFSFQTFWGGTSFASPQMNGVTSLLSQALHRRVGLLNVPLYLLAASGRSAGQHAPVRDITAGDNWYWFARPGYDQASGLGVPDVANLLESLQELED
ncbi:MAG TPA: S53 family peptidase [Steroidobacteraceae bacterium]|nr:S53 family peptidase [Steroidobacteraceae bacterium]